MQVYELPCPTWTQRSLPGVARTRPCPRFRSTVCGMSRSSVSPEQIQRELDETARLPIVAQLRELFVEPTMFDSVKSFGAAGFKLVAHSPRKIMAGSHRLVRGYLFKKYNNDRPTKKQLKNYMRRIEGARLLRTFIEEHGFQHVVAPQKWLYELPPDFPERYLLVVEKLDIVSYEKTRRGYDHIDRAQLRELATVLFHFRGLNSTAANLPFTEDGRIAFIDTERWHHQKDYLRKVGGHLSRDRRSLAMDVFEELESQGHRSLRTQFR